MKLLLDELAKARAIYDDREKTLYGEGAEAHRAGAVLAVNALVMFLRDSRVPHGDLQPLIDIWLHLPITAAASRTHYSHR